MCASTSDPTWQATYGVHVDIVNAQHTSFGIASNFDTVSPMQTLPPLPIVVALSIEPDSQNGMRGILALLDISDADAASGGVDAIVTCSSLL
jgi:hypothetical protein